MKIRMFSLLLIALLSLLSLPAGGCGDDDDDNDDNDDATVDDDDDDTGDDDDDATPDDDDDDDSAECSEGEKRCTDDILQREECVNGQWQLAENCMADYGRVCENGACVDPWTYGSPVVDDCADDPHATASSLAEKAAHYDELASRLHLHPDHGRIHHATLPAPLTEEDGTYEDVVDWHPGENDGLWTGLYAASQAFRYAVTQEPEALDNLHVLMDGLEIGMRITGVDGVFTREYITPGITGMNCPSDPMQYTVDPEKDDNKWVKVDADGTILVYDVDEAAFVRTAHQVSAEYAGYCWLDNVSQDEYAGHMLALGAVYKLVDDEGVRNRAAALLEDVAEHLMQNDMAFVDWDGRITEHGRFWLLALTDFPGFNAVMGLNMMLQGAIASGRADLRDYYDNCLLQKEGPNDCIDQFLTPPMPYQNWLWLIGLYLGPRSCKSNWNNMAMAFCHMFTLIWFEHDPAMRATYQQALEDYMFHFKDNERRMAVQHNAAWSLMYASMKRVGPDSTGQDVAAINDAVCGLRQFPESKTMIDLEVGEELYPTDMTCESRFDGEYLTFDPVPVHQRCPRTFTWWANPYEHQSCTADEQYVIQPADYLLPYWMARYFGYIDDQD